MSQPRSSFPRRRRPHSTGCCWRTPDGGDGSGDGRSGADDRGGGGDEEDDADGDVGGDDDDTNEELTLTPALGPGDLLG